MTNAYSYCFVSERTDVGCVRKGNEDNLVHFECKNGLVATVCDGMGGHVGGAVASQVAVDAIRQFLSENYFDSPFEAIGMAIDAANQAILDRTNIQPELQGMGSTCVMLIVRDGKVYIGSVGDSRVYLIRNRHIMQLTKDQSFVQMLVDRGDITKEQAEHHPRKNEITNCLGIPDMRPATVLPDAFCPEAGDCFLLCSDGLSGMVSDDQIEHIISKQAELSSQQRVDSLVELAKQNGGLDNITVQIVEFAITPDTLQKKKFPIKWIIALGGVLIILAALAVVYFLFLKKPNEVNLQEPKVELLCFENVPFTSNTFLYIIEGKQEGEKDTIYVKNEALQYGEMRAISKQENLISQLEAQDGIKFVYQEGKYIISSFEDLSSDTLAFKLGNDSLQYCIKVVKVSSPSEKAVASHQEPAKSKSNEENPQCPHQQQNGNTSNNGKNFIKTVISSTTTTKVGEKNRNELNPDESNAKSTEGTSEEVVDEGSNESAEKEKKPIEEDSNEQPKDSSNNQQTDQPDSSEVKGIVIEEDDDSSVQGG